MKTRSFRHTFLFLIAVTPALHGKEIEIQAGDHARKSGVIVIDNPENLPGGSLITKDGKRLPLQKQPDGKLIFLGGPLKAGEQVRYTIDSKSAPIETAVASPKDDQVIFAIDGLPVAAYQTTSKKDPRPNLDPKFLRGGYLHPLLTPHGKAVTDDYALNHLHHHGVWSAWTKTGFDGREPDFWNMGQGKGKVDFVSLEKTWSGPLEAGLISKHKFTDLTGGSPVDVLHETWTVKTYNTGANYNLIDLESEQTTATDKPLQLPIYHYGGFGIRGREEWNGKDAARFITSENVTDRNKANSQPARWIVMSGQVDGSPAGIAILSHPENFRAPQPIRTHPTEPFISFAPQTNEAMSIKPGETYRSKYRFIIFDGEPDAKLIESLWQAYAHPVTAKWIE